MVVSQVLPDTLATNLSEQSVLQVWGGHPLKGHVPISGAKNSALVLMAGALLASEPCVLRNVPALADIAGMGQILTTLGVKLRQDGNQLEIDASNITSTAAPYELVSRLRASFFALGPLLARMGSVQMPMPGGCAIGARPVDIHVRGLQQMGAEIFIENGIVNAHARRLKGARIYLDYPSVGATELLMMAATLAEGETILENAAQEPEVVDLADFCKAMGAKIYGAGTNTITIVGVPELHGTVYDIIPDRIEVGTYLMAAAITPGSDMTISPVVPEHLTAVLAKLKEVGVQITQEDPRTLRIVSQGNLQGADIETLPYPGFPTDMQALFLALLTVCEGSSVVSENVYENRMGHVAELIRMGANIRLKGKIAVVQGVPFLTGAPVAGTDLRAAAALVVAGLGAKGQTTISGLQYLDRGYEQMEDKLRALGARIERVAAKI